MIVGTGCSYFMQKYHSDITVVSQCDSGEGTVVFLFISYLYILLPLKGEYIENSERGSVRGGGLTVCGRIGRRKRGEGE